MELISGFVVAAVAFALGIVVGRFIAPNAQRIKELEQSLDDNNNQHQTYKEEVAQHFSQSADIFGDITEKYRSLYDHMSKGAYDLCDRRNIPRELATSHVNILAVESPDIAPQLSDSPLDLKLTPEDYIVDVSREGLSPLDTKSQKIIQENKSPPEETAEIINLDSQRPDDESKASPDLPPSEQAKDYAIKAKGVINHNSLNRDDVST